MAAQEVVFEGPSEPINYKKWIFRVSIHCEGCKRKVKKILQQVQGVFEIDIDTKQQKVTVIGDVDANTLLKKLTKAGKPAELWPVKAEENEKKQGKPKNKEKIIEQESNEDTSRTAENEKQAAKLPKVKAEPVQEPSKSAQGDGANIVSKGVVAAGGAAPKAQEPSKNNQSGAAKTGGESGGAAKTSGESSVSAKVIEGTAKTCTLDQVKESKVEEKKPDNNGPGAAQPSVVAEKKGGENDSTNTTGKVGGNDGGNSGKKKKKKGKNGNNAGGEQSSGTPAAKGSQNQEDGPPTASVPAYHSPPHDPTYYDYPAHYHGPPPVYAVSYSTSHPTNYTASYYAAPPPNSYVYTYPGVPEREPPPPPSDVDTYSRQPLDSFEIFSDENPNGCSVM